MIGMCIVLVSVFSNVFIDLAARDEVVNQLLYEKLLKEYGDTEWDTDTMHPALQAVQNDPQYQLYIAKKREEEASAKYKSFSVAPSIMNRFNAKEYENAENPREYPKLSFQ